MSISPIKTVAQVTQALMEHEVDKKNTVLTEGGCRAKDKSANRWSALFGGAGTPEVDKVAELYLGIILGASLADVEVKQRELVPLLQKGSELDVMISKISDKEIKANLLKAFEAARGKVEQIQNIKAELERAAKFLKEPIPLAIGFNESIDKHLYETNWHLKQLSNCKEDPDVGDVYRQLQTKKQELTADYNSLTPEIERNFSKFQSDCARAEKSIESGSKTELEKSLKNLQSYHNGFTAKVLKYKTTELMKKLWDGLQEIIWLEVKGKQGEGIDRYVRLSESGQKRQERSEDLQTVIEKLTEYQRDFQEIRGWIGGLKQAVEQLQSKTVGEGLKELRSETAGLTDEEVLSIGPHVSALRVSWNEESAEALDQLHGKVGPSLRKQIETVINNSLRNEASKALIGEGDPDRLKKIHRELGSRIGDAGGLTEKLWQKYCNVKRTLEWEEKVPQLKEVRNLLDDPQGSDLQERLEKRRTCIEDLQGFLKQYPKNNSFISAIEKLGNAQVETILTLTKARTLFGASAGGSGERTGCIAELKQFLTDHSYLPEEGQRVIREAINTLATIEKNAGIQRVVDEASKLRTDDPKLSGEALYNRAKSRKEFMEKLERIRTAQDTASYYKRGRIPEVMKELQEVQDRAILGMSRTIEKELENVRRFITYLEEEAREKCIGDLEKHLDNIFLSESLKQNVKDVIEVVTWPTVGPVREGLAYAQTVMEDPVDEERLKERLVVRDACIVGLQNHLKKTLPGAIKDEIKAMIGQLQRAQDAAAIRIALKGAPKGADKKYYRSQSLIWHPDKQNKLPDWMQGISPDEKKRISEEIFKKVDAYKLKG